MRRADGELRTALVTGACSGIGRELANELASLGYELVLVSNRKAEIEATSVELQASHKITAHPVAIDLARPEAAGELYEAVKQRGIAIDILVNNAGFFFFGDAVEVDPARANAMLQLHVVTPSLLCTLFGRDMRERRRGHILVTSSISAWRDFPSISYYGTTKKFLRGFARALRSELSGYGVNVTCLAPGATATGLYDPNVIDIDLGRRVGVMMDAREVARAGLRAMFRRRAECIPGLISKLMTYASLLVPQLAIDLIHRWYSARQRRIAA